MNYKTMESAALEARKAEIAVETETEGADLDALLEEVRAINEELETRKAEEAKKVELREMVAMQDAGETVDEVESNQENRGETEEMEIRNSKEYIDAFANYLRTGRDDECRTLLTENVTGGTVPVPEFVEDVIKTAWERSTLMQLVRKTYLKGNLKVGFEISSSDAVVHVEGSGAIEEENLQLGIVNLTANSIKKWVSITDEVEDSTEDFIRYIYDELTYRIAKAAEKALLQKIALSPETSSASAPAVAKVTVADSLNMTALIEAQGKLSGDAQDMTLVTTRALAAGLRLDALSASYAYDPFAGMRVVYGDSMPEGVLAIVGDFGYGAQANFPNGEEIRIKKNDLSRAKEDVVEYIGRQFVGLGVVAPNAFCQIIKGN